VDYAFKVGLPFLPELPMADPQEFILTRGLGELPGLTFDTPKSTKLVLSEWRAQCDSFNARLEKADREQNYDAFLPRSSCWTAFVDLLVQRRCSYAKVQIVGPVTAQWALQIIGGESASESSAVDNLPELVAQIFRLVKARALAMMQVLTAKQIRTVLFLDEPGLFDISPQNPRHLMVLEELHLLVLTLKVFGIAVGLHCCSNSDWIVPHRMEFDILSLDFSVVSSPTESGGTGRALAKFLSYGGTVAWGIVPTTQTPIPSAAKLLEGMLHTMRHVWMWPPAFIQAVLTHQSLFTPSCGLALLDAPLALVVLDRLRELEMFLAS